MKQNVEEGNLYHTITEKGATMTRYLMVSLVFLFTLDHLFALPRFAARSNAKCQSCHVNPTGAGMRNFYGSTSYGREALPIESWQEEFALEEFSTQLTDFISYGLDFRFLYFYQKKDNPDATRSSFFPMQMDVYFNLRVSKKINVYVNPAFGPYARYEVFGTASILPLDGYIKAGRFTPSYGLRIDDHNVYVREKTPFRNNLGQAAGIEIGANPGPFMVLVSATNTAGERDVQLPKAILAKVETRFNLDKFNFLFGGSSFNRVTPQDKINLLGGYALVAWDGNLIIQGAVEYIRGNSLDMSLNGQRHSEIGGSNTSLINLKQLAYTIEADYAVIQGIDLKFIYDFFDPDTDLKTGTAKRYSGGLEFFPISGVEIRPLYRYTDDSVLSRKTNDVHVLLHFYL